MKTESDKEDIIKLVIDPTSLKRFKAKVYALDFGKLKTFSPLKSINGYSK